MTANTPKFVWYELMTEDLKAAESFYRSVTGWDAKDAGMPDYAYTLLSIKNAMVAGMMAMPEEVRAMGAKPCWIGYVGVDDVDAYANKVKEAGGSIHRAPEDIPGIGRFAVVADPHGAVFSLFKGDDEAPPSVPMQTPGHIGWHELYAGDQESAFAFYSKIFGWTKHEALDMGPMGIYQIFAVNGEPVGGMMTKTPDMPHPCWQYYINVESIDAAVAQVNEAGGKIILEPHQVPGGSWITQGLDPQGAMFALVAPKR